VANVGGDSPNSDELKRPDDEAMSVDELKRPDDEALSDEPVAEPTTTPTDEGDDMVMVDAMPDESVTMVGMTGLADESQTAEEAAEVEDDLADIETLEEETEHHEGVEEAAVEEEKEVEEEEEKKPKEIPLYVELAVAGGISAVLLLLAWFQVVLFSTALYLIAVGFVPYGIWKGRETNTVYSVMLGCALVAVLTAIYCLWLEVGRYGFEVKAKLPQPLSMSRPIQSGADTTTATAWPALVRLTSNAAGLDDLSGSSWMT
jgi:cation transport ATPase